jgi:hypothetical protein
MKRQLATFFLTAGLSAALGPLSLSAQSTTTAIAEIPFAFQVQQRTLPAGKYTIDRKSTAGLFQVFDHEGHSIFLTAPVQVKSDPEEPKLSFACYGSDCVLAKIGMPGGEVGYSLSQSSIERNLHRRVGMTPMISIRLKSK